MATQATTPKHKPVDIKTIGGLLEILGENINSIYEDDSDQNIKKTNAILQNVNAIKGIYGLAFDKMRLGNIKQINKSSHDFGDNDYFKSEELLGSVFGDDTDRLARDHRREQEIKQNDYERAVEKLKAEIENNKDNPDVSRDDYKYENFDDDTVDIFNGILYKASEKTDLSTEYKKDLYLLKHIKPADFGVEE